MAATDLTTLNALKQYLNKTGNESDSELTGYITQISKAIRSDVSRDLVPVKSYNVNVDGNGKCRIYVPNAPIVAIQSITVSGRAIAAAPMPVISTYQTGYVFNDDYIDLIGYEFCKGRMNVNLQYKAGFAVLAEQQIIPASATNGVYTLTALAPEGNWNSDLGMTYTTGGAALTLVASSPAVGQYSVNDGVYTFNSADAGNGVNLNYGYVPADIERACIEWAAYRYMQKNRIGVTSKSTGPGDSTTFQKDVMPDTVLLTLEQYRRVPYV